MNLLYVWGGVILLLVASFVGVIWFVWWFLNSIRVVGVDPRSGQVWVRRVRPKDGIYTWRDGDDKIALALADGFTYQSPRGRLFLADLASGHVFRIKAENRQRPAPGEPPASPAEVDAERIPGRLLHQIREDTRLMQMAKAAQKPFGWVEKFAGPIVVLAFVMLVAILWILWGVSRHLGDAVGADITGPPPAAGMILGWWF